MTRISADVNFVLMFWKRGTAMKMEKHVCRLMSACAPPSAVADSLPQRE